jgi:UDP-N-acetylmuramate dehydrogenase
MNCECINNISLSERTWIHRGGNANYYYIPNSVEELIEVGRYLYSDKREFLTIGHTSNIYFKNSFNINSIIDTKRLSSYKILDKDTLVADCGTHMSKLSKYCVENGFVGYEGMINLLGTLGGAIVNNSGCYNCGIDKVLKSIDLLTPDGRIENITRKELGYTFRKSRIKTGEIKGIILRAYLDISAKGNTEELKRIAAINTCNRKMTQDPPAYNLGTTINYSTYKLNVKNILIALISRFLNLVTSDFTKRTRALKKVILFMYGRTYLSKYISDKRINCFLWVDENADLFFDDYVSLLSEVYKHSEMEIEIKQPLK